MTTRTALEMVTEIHGALAAAGLPRTSSYNGGEIVGWTNSLGSTGFSVRETQDGALQWHVVVSGEPHLRYHRYESKGDELHDPIAPEALAPRIRTVFEAAGLLVSSVDYAGHQTMWDDDVDYDIVTTRPEWLEPSPHRRPPASRRSGS